LLSVAAPGCEGVTFVVTPVGPTSTFAQIVPVPGPTVSGPGLDLANIIVARGPLTPVGFPYEVDFEMRESKGEGLFVSSLDYVGPAGPTHSCSVGFYMRPGQTLPPPRNCRDFFNRTSFTSLDLTVRFSDAAGRTGSVTAHVPVRAGAYRGGAN
jgi:hypothetical protein